ncbi:MAG: VOC family protein [Planctomycetota bacterium]
MQTPIRRIGIILYVTRYEACVRFYRDLLGFEVLFDTPTLTCFDFGGAYLMVEMDDEPPESGRPSGPFTCLRLNVEDVVAQAKALQEGGVELDLQIHDWGTVAKFHDPDGNLIAFKDEAGFQRQVEGSA